MQQGFLLTRHSHDKDGETEIIFWLSTPDGPTQLKVKGEKPVCFIYQDDVARVEQALSGIDFGQGQSVGQGYEVRPLALKSFQQQPVCGLYLPTIKMFHQAVERLRQQGIQMLENDFRLHDRYLMERWIRGGVVFQGKNSQRKGLHGSRFTRVDQARLKGGDYIPQLKVVSLDLECSAKGDLYSVGLYSDAISLVLMIGPGDDGPQIRFEEYGEHKAAEEKGLVRWVENEKALLQALEATIAELDPDVIIGWNVVGFDFRLLNTRAQRYGMRLKLGRGGSYASWRESKDDSNSGFITIPGRVVIDGIAALKTATYNFASFSLESVAQELLNRGKLTEDVDDRLATIMHDFQHNKLKLAAYNLEDCRLVWDIFQHTRILDFLILRSQLTGLELDRSGGSVAAFTNLYLPKLHRAGYVAPNLPDGGGLASPGGYVMDSLPGLYNNVLVLDFKSLYPSIIRTFKIDPLGLIEGGLHPEQAIPGYRGACFSRDQHFLPDIITSLWQQRDEAKKAQDPVRSQALKILMNSFYGVLGSGGCRFYDTRLASSITMRGHDILKQTTEWIEQKGLKVIYGDTDSLFVLMGNDLQQSGGQQAISRAQSLCSQQTVSSKQADQLGNELMQEINQRWRDHLADVYGLECFLELEYETHFTRFLMPTIRGQDTGSKKRYAGLINKNGQEKLVFKGLEAVRTDWTELAKELQNEIYNRVFHDQNPCDLISALVAELKAGQRDHQLVYSKRLRRSLDDYVKNVPPHVRAARLADEINRQQGKPLKYQRKGRIAYVMTSNGPEPVEYQQSPIDYQHYIDKQVQPIADAILPFVGLSFSAIVDDQMQLF